MRTLALVLVLVASIRAGEETEAMQLARKVYAAWQRTADTKPPSNSSDDVAMRRFKKSGPTAGTVNRASFASAFARTDFAAWDADKDSDLLRHGLFLAAQSAYLEGLPGAAVRAADLFLSRHPKHPGITEIRGYHLPAALLVAGKVARALTVARAHAAALDGAPGARALILLGDLELIHGNGKAARAAYEQAFAQTHDVDEPRPFDIREADWKKLEYRHAHRMARAEIVVRRDRVGRRLGVVRAQFIGPARAALARTGHRKALFFFGPAKDGDLAQLLALDALAQNLGNGVFRLVGATWFENLGSTQYDRDAPKDTRWIRMPRDTCAYVRLRDLKRALKKYGEAHQVSAPFAILRKVNATTHVGKWQQRLLLVTDAENRILFACRDGAEPIVTATVRALVGR